MKRRRSWTGRLRPANIRLLGAPLVGGKPLIAKIRVGFASVISLQIRHVPATTKMRGYADGNISARIERRITPVLSTGRGAPRPPFYITNFAATITIPVTNAKVQEASKMSMMTAMVRSPYSRPPLAPRP